MVTSTLVREYDLFQLYNTKNIFAIVLKINFFNPFKLETYILFIGLEKVNIILKYKLV